MSHILVIEDDPKTAKVIEAELAARGHAVVVAADGTTGLERATRDPFDLITLDRMLPGTDGLAVVSRLRERAIRVPVLMISALSDVDERIAGLRAGGDDYLVKPFSSEEMVARVEALLRRAPQSSAEMLVRSGDLKLNLLRRTVHLDGQPLRLPHMEFRLLEFLVQNAGRTVSRKFIFGRVWGCGSASRRDPGQNLKDPSDFR